MNTNAFVLSLLSLSAQFRRHSLQPPSWRARFEALALSSFLRIWHIYKFALRIITGQGAIARLCRRGLESQSLRIDEKRIEFQSREVRNILWRIDAEFRLSAMLTDEYATIIDVSRERSKTNGNGSELQDIASEIAVAVQQKKRINNIYIPFLTDTITSMILVETGKEILLRQGRKNVMSVIHQDLLDEIWLAVIVSDQHTHSDAESELTLYDEKDHAQKSSVDWVKLGFQGKSPETDFRATGLLGLKHLHSFCVTYPILARRIVNESGSSQPLQITEPWYPFALAGIHITRAILETLSAGLLQRDIYMKVNGDVVDSVARICQDLYDRLLEEFHAYWMGLVRDGLIKDIFAFERVFGEFKRSKGLL